MQSTTHLSSQFHKAFLLPTIRTKRFAKLYYRRCLFGLIRWNKEKDQLQHNPSHLQCILGISTHYLYRFSFKESSKL
ncbi:uncharacterized protein LOC129893493 isoform X3 [Solanum dulcamara]|uniref:uncharacterized protein LOC129893493 isoform X3 n=1 Tax=Solanum dulcamara TaxID=45834 RepID=UPI002485ECDB|nr:uncharacterized protein LOC129893493 isoform X3 [Solanum dulcamara]